MNSPLRSSVLTRHAVLRTACRAGALFVASLTGFTVWSQAVPAFAATAAGTPAAGTSAPATSPTTPLQADVPSVMVVPTNTTQSDPDGGQWFYFSLKPGQSASSEARITNPADVPQTVQLAIDDLEFTPTGTPYVNYGKQTDVGSWAHFDVPSVTVPPKTSVLVPYALTVGANAEPGDHFGVAVVRSAPEAVKGSKALRLVKVVAVRFYVTVPGIATKSFQIGQISGKLNSVLLPSYSLVSVPVRNTGRVRFNADVTIGGIKAKGSPLILAKSTEVYTAKVPVHVYGGPVNENVVVRTNYAGLTKSASHSQFVFPYVIIALLLLIALAGYGLAMLIRRRIRKQRGLRADLRRLESMVLQRPGMAGSAAGPGSAGSAAGSPGSGGSPESSGSGPTNNAAVSAMESAIKRARRTGHTETLPELAIALHEAGGDALDALLESMPVANGRTPKIMKALSAYPAERIQASPRLAQLSESDRARLTSMGTGAVGEFGAGPRGNAPQPVR